MNKRRVSIVMCTYNGAPWLRQQLESVLAQTYPLYEIIIQDDHSADGTYALLKDFAARHSIIKLFTNGSGRKGVNANFFSAMNRAAGDFIAPCDQDDIWEKDKIASQVETIGDHLMCGGFSRPFSDDGSFAFFDKRIPNLSVTRLITNTAIPGHVMLFSRRLLDLLPPPDHIIYRERCYDLILQVVAAAYGSIVFPDKVMVNQRKHRGAATCTNFSRDLPSITNSFHTLLWSLRHYRRTRPLVKQAMTVWKALLDTLRSRDDSFLTAKKFIDYEIKDGPIAFLLLTAFCLRHSSQLFWTEGASVKHILNALVYPITIGYRYRRAIENSDAKG